MERSLAQGVNVAASEVPDCVLPGVVEAFSLREVNFGLKEVAEALRGEQLCFRSVSDDAAVFQHEDAIDLGDDVGNMVSDEEDSGTLLGEATEQVA